MWYNKVMKFSFDRHKLKIGMRTAKTGLAVFLVLLFFGWLDWSGAQIAALTAVFSLREDFDKSLSFGASRILGNTIGGLVALIYYLLIGWFGSGYWVTILVLPVLVMLTIVCNVAWNNASGVVGSTATLLIIALSVPETSSHFYVMTRVFQTFCGVFVAMLVNADAQKWQYILEKWLKQKSNKE